MTKLRSFTIIGAMEDTQSTSESTKSGNSKMVVVAGVVALFLILLGVGAYMLGGNRTNTQTTVQNVAQNNPSPTSATIVTSIKDALAKSQSLQCTYTDANGVSTVVYIKSGAIRTDYTGKTAQESGSVIMKDNKMYSWNGKQGMMMTFDISKLESVTPGAQKVTPGQKDPNEVVGNLEQYKESCTPANVADSVFVPPTDIKFTDFSSMMKQGTQTNPSGTTGGAMTEEQIKQLQKQYQQ